MTRYKQESTKYRKIVAVVLILLAVLAAVWLAERWYTRHKTSAAAAGVNPIGQLLTGQPDPAEPYTGTISLVVAGYDRSAEDGEEEIGLTDMILYLQWDCDRNKLEVLQVPPSLYVGWSTGQAEAGEGEENAADPTGQGSTTGRINAVARETGGLQGLCDEITAMTGLPVDGYLGMDLNGLGDIVEYIGGIEVVKAFSQSAGSYKKYSDAVNYNANYYVDWMRENQKTMSAYNAILPSVLICVLPCGFAFWLSGSLELSTFLSIVIFSLGLIGPIIAAFTFTDDLAVLGTNVEEISQLLNAEELNHKETPIKLEDTGISLRSVSFSYDGTTEVLHDVNLAIHPGTMTALVGPSGSGKSTVAKLIAGYWDVTSGSITLGGHELKDMPLSEIADQISYVSQDNYLFNRSIRENIRMGRPSATDAEVEQAAKQSGCDAFIRKLDNGYDTVVGSAGSHLSGGERQRIAIARAMLKNASVVILDEATAYIDPENEALVQKAISTLTVGKTLIVIAHRLSTIVGADNIVVVKDGTIHAQGTHEKLLETCPLYRDMWQAHIGAKDQM